MKHTFPTTVGARVEEKQDSGHPGNYWISCGNFMLTLRNLCHLRTLRDIAVIEVIKLDVEGANN